MINKENKDKDKNKPDESAKVHVSAHVKIKDAESGKVYVNKRG